MLTQNQLLHFRRLQGKMAIVADIKGSEDLMKVQEEIERWVNAQLRAEIVKTFHGMKVTPVVTIGWASMRAQEIADFRALQAESFTIAAMHGFDVWKNKQFQIEQWVGDLIDRRVLAAVSPFIKVGPSLN